MARPARTDEDIDALVWPVADEQSELATGELPTNRAVAAAVRARGNPISTAHVMKSLGRWAERRPQRVTVPSEPLPPELLRMLAGWLEHDRQGNRAELDARITGLTATNEDLAREALENEAELAILQAQLAEQARERDTLAGQLAEVNAGRGKLAEELQDERETVEQLRTKLVTADLRVQELDTLRADHAQLRKDFQGERDARIKAEKDLSGERATKEALTRQVADLEAREKTAVAEARELRKQLAERTEHLQTVESQRAQAVGEAGAAQGALKQLTIELEHQRQDFVRAQTEKAEAVRTAGVADGARASAEKRVQELESALTQCQQERERLAGENGRLKGQASAGEEGRARGGGEKK